MAAPPNCQFVGQVLPLKMVTGNPLVQRAKPESCQPPIMASSTPPASRASSLPLPKGICQIQFRLNWCRASKSETPRNWFGSQELIMFPLNPPHSETRSAEDERSMDLENV